MTEIQVRQIVREYISTHLSIQIESGWEYGCDDDYEKMRIRLVLDGETISDDFQYVKR